MEKMREEFEAWIRHYIGDSWLKPDESRSGEYLDNNTQHMWESWQASRAAQCVELPDSERSVDCGDVLYRSDVEEALDAAGIRYT